MNIDIEQNAGDTIRGIIRERIEKGIKKSLPSVREVIKTSIADRFDSESAGTPVLPFNTPGGSWKELSPATLKRRKKNNVKKLVVRGQLRKYFSVTQNGFSLLVTNNRSANNYSLFLIHQLGTERVPKRPMLALQQEELDEIIDIIREKIEGI